MGEQATAAVRPAPTNITVSLVDRDLWKKFKNVGNEMIVTHDRIMIYLDDILIMVPLYGGVQEPSTGDSDPHPPGFRDQC